MLSPQQEVTSEFTKTDNKAKLWSILQDNGAFNGISNNFFSKVREDFEINIVQVEEHMKQKGKMEKNKFFLDTMIQKMRGYREQSRTQPYTANDIQQQRREAFENDLSQKQRDFDSYNSKPQPDTIDFKDKDDDNTTSVNSLLEKAMRDREDLTIPPPITQNTTPISGSSASANTTASTVKDFSNGKEKDILQEILTKLNDLEQLIRNLER